MNFFFQILSLHFIGLKDLVLTFFTLLLIETFLWVNFSQVGFNIYSFWLLLRLLLLLLDDLLLISEKIVILRFRRFLLFFQLFFLFHSFFLVDLFLNDGNSWCFGLDLSGSSIINSYLFFNLAQSSFSKAKFKTQLFILIYQPCFLVLLLW